MDWFAILNAGLAATAVMTIVMYVAPIMGMPKMDIISMLGTMFTSNDGAAKAIGLVAHFMMGIVFVIIYASVWNIGLGQPTWIWGLVFGGIHGLLVLIVMPLVMTMHPRRP